MNISDIPVGQFRRSLRKRGSRRRSPKTVQLVEAIQSLGSGRAKAVIPDPGEDLAKVRRRLMYAARIAGVRLRTALLENRVVFTRQPRRTGHRRSVCWRRGRY